MRHLTLQAAKVSTLSSFWSKLKTNPATGCEEWTGATNSDGYGVVRVLKSGSGSIRYAHRLALTLDLGDLPETAVVMHACDNRKCCNPDHLSVGTWAENMDEMIEKGRNKGQMWGRKGSR